MNTKKYLQKLEALLNTSSTTFMLVALVCLFVIPVVIAQSLDPVIESSDQVPRVVGVFDTSLDSVRLAESDSSNIKSAADVDINGSVLGAQDVQDISLLVKEDEKGMKSLSAISNKTLKEYSVNINFQSRFNKTNVFSIENVSSGDRYFKLSVVNLGSVKNLNSTGKVLYLGDKTYELTQILTNIDLKLAPSEKIMVSLSSPKTNPTNVSLILVMQ